MSEPIPAWINKGPNSKSTMPDWVRAHMVGRVEANGTFLIKTKCGREEAKARVNVGDLVFERKGIAYAREPAEARSLIVELDEKDSGVYGALPKGSGSARSTFSEADVADRSDDTDDISARIATQVSIPKLAISPSPITPDPQSIHGKSGQSRQNVRIEKPAFKTNRPRGQRPTIEWIHLERLLVDDYQRSTSTSSSQALIKRMARDWDWTLCVPLMVSRRADGFYVIDGQHRLEAAKLRSDMPDLPCCITTFADKAAEAAMFVAANRLRRPMNRLDILHAALSAGETEAVALKTLVESVGFTIARDTGWQSWAPGEVAFTSAIAAAMRKHGEELSSVTLKAMADAFTGQVLIGGGAIFSATIRILAEPPEGFERDRLFAALKRFDAKGWASMIDGQESGADRTTAMKDALLMAYEEVPA